MKFTQAWAATAAQNITLKTAVATLSIVTIVLGVATVKLAIKEPIIIERACYSREIPKSSGTRTTAEIEAFVREAIKQRFDSDTNGKPVFLSDEEAQARLAEQKELAIKGMTQHVLINSVKVDGSTVTIDADRLISVGQIRSALLFPLSLTLGTETRSETNPYGLVAIKVVPQRSAGGEK